jgi:hypothetical protein
VAATERKAIKMKDAVSAFCIVERRTPDGMKPNDLDGSYEGTGGSFRESKGLKMWFFRSRNGPNCTASIKTDPERYECARSATRVY